MTEKMTPEEQARYDAQAKAEAWDLATRILQPWVQATREIGHPELTRVMEHAFEEAEREYCRAGPGRSRAPRAERDAVVNQPGRGPARLLPQSPGLLPKSSRSQPRKPRLGRRSGAGGVGCSAARDKERKEATLVELDIIYKYHAPDQRPRDATTIATDTMDVEDSEIWTNLHNLHPVGHVISLPTDDPDEYGEQSKEYVVVARCPLQAPIEDSGLLMAALTVVVTDS